MDTYNGRKAVSSIAVCSTGRDLVAFAGAANVLNLWDPRQGHAEGEASPHPTLHPFQLWDRMLMLPDQLQGGKTFASHASHIHALAWQPNSEHHVVTASMDKTLKLWDLRAAVPLHTLEGHTAQVNGFASLLSPLGVCSVLSHLPLVLHRCYVLRGGRAAKLSVAVQITQSELIKQGCKAGHMASCICPARPMQSK